MEAGRKKVPRRGEVWIVSFDPKVGDEISKTRPAIVVNVDEVGNLALRMVVPVTGWDNRYERFPWLVRIKAGRRNGLTKESVADAFQAKSLSLERFDRCIGMVSAPAIEDIAAAIALCIGYVADSPATSNGEQAVPKWIPPRQYHIVDVQSV